jgi:hypothetical protein
MIPVGGGLKSPALQSDLSASKGDIIRRFPGRTELLSEFHKIWANVEENLDLALTSEEALRLLQSLVVYDIPDGTRSTLTVRPDVDVGVDAALYCLSLIHTLKSLGAKSCVLMTHTVYNRMRGSEGLNRILKLLKDGVRPIAEYSRNEKVAVHLVGMRKEYELRNHLLEYIPAVEEGSFDAFFLVDHSEDLFNDPEIRRQLETLPQIDVCIRHTKFSLSGGWIPDKLLGSTFMYCQNGTLFTNWTFDELVALVTVALLAKLMHSGEGLVKMYGDVDEIKLRYQLRELKLFNKQVFLRRHPTKLFLLGSPYGIYQFYY